MSFEPIATPSSSRGLRKTAAAVALVLAVPAAYAQSDAQVYESAIAQAARICPGHAKERTTPGIRAVPVGALRVLAQRSYTMCPDRRLDPATPAVWYGADGVFAHHRHLVERDAVEQDLHVLDAVDGHARLAHVAFEPAHAPPGKRVGEGELWLGNPARLARTLSEREIEQLQYSAQHYVRLKDRYLGMLSG